MRLTRLCRCALNAASASGSAAAPAFRHRSSSPYETLGVTRSTPADEVREAYIRLAKDLHPDRQMEIGVDDRAEAEARFKEVQSAWYILGDAARRREFDEHGTLAAPPAAWSPLMWARLRKAKPEEGVLMPNWGSEEPPRWLLASFPTSVVLLSFLYSAKGDMWNMMKDQRALRAGGWPCPDCLIINGPQEVCCTKCGLERTTAFPK